MPAMGGLQVSRALTRFAHQVGETKETVADVIAPVIPVQTKEGTYYLHGFEGLTDDIDLHRGRLDEPIMLPWDTTTSTYACINSEAMEFVSDEDRRTADVGVALETAGVRKIVGVIKLQTEKKIKTLMETVRDTSGRSTAKQVKWSLGTSKIEDDFRKAERKVEVQCGLPATHAVIPPSVADVMAQSAEIREIRKYTDSSLLINGRIPQTLWGLQVVLPGTIQQTANVGQITLPDTGVATSFVWSDDDVYLMYVNPNPTILSTCFAYQLRWTDYYTKRLRNDKLGGGGTEIITGFSQDEKVISTLCCHAITDVLT